MSNLFGKLQIGLSTEQPLQKEEPKRDLRQEVRFFLDDITDLAIQKFVDEEEIEEAKAAPKA